MSANSPLQYAANLVPDAARRNPVLLRAMIGAIAVASPVRLLGGSAPAVPAPPADEVRLIKSIPVPARPAPPLPPPPESPPTVTRKKFDVKLTPAELAALRLPTTPFPTVLPPLGLSRLGSEIKKTKFDLDPLEVRAGEAGAHRRSQNELPYLDLEEGRKWKRPLRDSSHAVLFVSLLMNAGIATSLDVGGALLRVTESNEPNCAEIETGERDGTGEIHWVEMRYRVPVDVYDGRQFAQLPLLTLRLDRGKGTWDVFSGFVRVAADLPLEGASKVAKREINIEPGTAGAWVSGLVVSEENPLFDDENKDGVDDGLEWMVTETAEGKRDKKLDEPTPVAAQWTPTLHVLRPLPDSITKAKVGGAKPSGSAEGRP